MIFFKQTLKHKLFFISLLPVLFLGILFLFISISSIKDVAESEILSTLNGICLQLRKDFTNKYNGNYTENNGTFFSKNINISDFSHRLDEFKNNFNAEVTIFYGNKRALTTIRNNNGIRIINTVQNDKNVINTVFNGDTYTSGGVLINNEKYYVSYIPLYDNNQIVGMVFAGISNKNFLQSIKTLIINVTIVIIIIVFILSIIISIVAQRLGNSFVSIKNYLNLLVKTQNKQVLMDEFVLQREDEIGDLGRYAQEVGNKLNQMISLDTLTNIYNRRAGTQFIDYYFNKACSETIPFTVVMCDIDFFKSINDKYGHKAGDEVLIKVSSILKESGSVFAIRWGGEEFLLGFTKTTQDVVAILQDTANIIRNLSFSYNGINFGVTLTFGIATYSSQPDSSTLVVQADKNLYKGKNSGRDSIVY